MTDFNSFRNAVLEDDDLQEAVISIINTATTNGSGMGDGIATNSLSSIMEREHQEYNSNCVRERNHDFHPVLPGQKWTTRMIQVSSLRFHV